jgi:hypothetical protein
MMWWLLAFVCVAVGVRGDETPLAPVPVSAPAPAPAPMPAPATRPKTMNQKFIELLEEAKAIHCLERSEELVDMALKRFNATIWKLRVPQAVLPWGIDEFTCTGPNKVPYDAMPKFCTTLCDPEQSNMLLACNRSNVLTPAQVNWVKEALVHPELPSFFCVGTLRIEEKDMATPCSCV